MVPFTVPAAGAVMLTVGGVTFDTVTGMGAESTVAPLVGRTVAVSVWAPLETGAVFQLTEYGEVVSSEPRLAPSSLN